MLERAADRGHHVDAWPFGPDILNTARDLDAFRQQSALRLNRRPGLRKRKAPDVRGIGPRQLPDTGQGLGHILTRMLFKTLPRIRAQDPRHQVFAQRDEWIALTFLGELLRAFIRLGILPGMPGEPGYTQT